MSREKLDWTRISAPLVLAEDLVARLDERVRSSPIRTGWLERSHFADACASVWIEGNLAHLEDLVLHDVHMDVRAPTSEIIRAYRVLAARRAICVAAPDWAFTPGGLAALRSAEGVVEEAVGQDRKREEPEEVGLENGDLGADDLFSAELAALDAAMAGAARALERRSIALEDRDSLIYDLDWSEDERLVQWRKDVDATFGLPPILAAAMAAAMWDEIEPLQHASWLGRVLAAALLRQRSKTKSILLGVNSGVRAVQRPQFKVLGWNEKIVLWLTAMAAGAEQGLEDHDRWLMARASRLEMLHRRQLNSRLPAALDLVMARPIVTAEIVAQELRVSARAAKILISELGLRELTGRSRYRAWGIL